MTPSEWLCCLQILNTVERNQDRKYAPTSSPDLFAQRGQQRLCSSVCWQSQSSEACMLHWLPLLHGGESRTERAEAESTLFARLLFNRCYVTPTFVVWTINSCFSFKSCFYLNQAKGWFAASNLIFPNAANPCGMREKLWASQHSWAASCCKTCASQDCFQQKTFWATF